MGDPERFDDSQDDGALDYISRRICLPWVVRLHVELGDISIATVERSCELREEGPVSRAWGGWSWIGGGIKRHVKLGKQSIGDGRHIQDGDWAREGYVRELRSQSSRLRKG